MNWQASKLVISLVLISLGAGVISVFMAGLSTSYDVTYDNESIDTFQQLDSITLSMQEVQNRTASAGRDSTGIVDALSGFFSDAYQALLITSNSYSTLQTMIDHALSQANLGTTGTLFKTAFLTIILAVIFIGIVIAAIIKRDA